MGGSLLWLLRLAAMARIASLPSCTSDTASRGMGNCTLALPCSPCIDRKLIKVRAVVHGQQSDIFWLRVKRAMETAAEHMTIDFRLDLQVRKSEMEMAANILSVVEEQPDVLITTIVGPGVHAAIARARQSTILFTLNAGLDLFQSMGSKAHFQQDEYLGGYNSVQHFQKAGTDRNFPVVRCLALNYGRGLGWSIPRVNGFKAKCEEEGLEFEEYFDVDGEDRDSTKDGAELVFQAFLDSPAAATGSLATLLVGGTISFGVRDAWRAKGRPANILLGTFDTDVDGLAAGELVFMINQNEWLQGYMPVVLSTIYVTTGNLMAATLYPTGPDFITAAPTANNSQDEWEAFPVCRCPWIGGYEDKVNCQGAPPIGDCPAVGGCERPCKDVRRFQIRGVTHGHESDAFWFVVKAGAEQAANDLRLVGFEMDLFGPPGSGREDAFSEARFEEAVRSAADQDDVDALFVSIHGDYVQDDVTYAASKKLVVTINSGSTVSPSLNPANGKLLSHVGQDEYIAGKLGGQRLAEYGVTHVACLNHDTGNVDMSARCIGARDYLESVGKSLTILSLKDQSPPIPDDDDSAIVRYVKAALQSQPGIDGMLALTSSLVPAAVAGIRQAGRAKGQFWAGSFDVSAALMEAIGRGDYFLFGADQQPYMQGYMAVVYMAVHLLTRQKMAMPVIPSGPFFTVPDPAKDECLARQWEAAAVGAGRMPLRDSVNTVGFPVCELPGACSDPASFFNTTTFKCQRCPAGKYKTMLMVKCQDCDAGSSTNGENGVEQCTPCAPGTSAGRAGQATCQRCPLGFYSPGKAAQTCEGCPAGFMTEYLGAVDASECKCPAEAYRDSSERTACRKCPLGMACAFGADAAAGADVAPRLMAGYWSDPVAPLEVFRCENENRCPADRAPGECGPHLTSRACAHCEEGWDWSSDRCVECGSVASSSVTLVIAILAFPAIICIMYWKFRDPHARWGSWRNGIASIGFIILNHYQIVTLLSGSTVPLPTNAASVFDIVAVSSDVLTVFRLGCMGLGSFKDGLILKSSAPILVFALFLLTWSTSRLVSRYRFCQELRMNSDRMVNNFFSVMFTFFAGIVSIAFTIFKCAPNPNETSSLVADRSILCFEAEWDGMLAIGLLAVLFWCVGFGVLFARTVIVAPKWFYDTSFQMRWKFLFIKYRPDVHWWALVIMAKGIMFNIGFLCFGIGVLQIFWMMLCLTVYTGLVVRFMPWRQVHVNGVDVMAHLCLMLSCSALVWFARNIEEGEVARLDAGISQLAIALAFSIVPLSVPAMLLMAHSQESQYARAQKMAEIAAIRETMAGVGECPQHDFTEAVLALGDWDYSGLAFAKGVLLTEFMGVKSRRGLSTRTRSMQSSTSSASACEVEDAPRKEGCPVEEVGETLSDISAEIRPNVKGGLVPWGAIPGTAR